MDDIVFARAIHVLTAVIWIGGVSMATTVVLPAIRRGELGDDWHKAFQAIEHRFVWQARTAVIVVGFTGLYMTMRLDLWARFASAHFWWMHAMVGLWLLYALVLFLVEPFFVGRKFEKRATVAPQLAFKSLYLGHLVLLAISFITILGAAAGSQGWSVF
jgi:uncharacterized membrane protein